MKILISGASGLVGSAVVPFLRGRGHEVRSLVRTFSSSADEVFWNPQTGELDRVKLDAWRGPEAVVHLAGENISSGRWTEERKRRIRDSRVSATRLLAESLLKIAEPPRLFIGASAVGYYGNRHGEWIRESDPPGEGFLARVGRGWEEAADPLRQLLARIVHLRFGMILSGKGGALEKMLPIFRAGLGGPLGSGKQWWSWIALEDVVRVIDFVFNNESAEGPFNAVSPNPVQNAEFTRTLARVLRRPAFLPVPAPFLRLVFGEMADEVLLSSQRVAPEKLLRAGFCFAQPELEEALRSILGAPGAARHGSAPPR